jgi:hypothetical protein
VKPLSILAFALPTALAAPAAAQPAPTSSPAPDSPQAPRPIDGGERSWRVEAGYRGSYIPSYGYQPFSNNGYFPEFSLSGSRTILERGRFSFACGLAWDMGSSGSVVRQTDETSLSMQRFTVTLEGRAHLGASDHWGYAYLRAAPGAALEKAKVDDAASPGPLERSAWRFATDLSAGYAFPIWPWGAASSAEPRVWVQSEGGYGWVAGEDLALEPALASGSSVRTAGVDLGTLAMQGGFFRIAAAVTF